MKRILFQLLKKGNNNAVKVFLLGLGLAMGLVLIAKVYYERVYDNYMQDVNRVYIVKSDYKTLDGSRSYESTPGAIAPGIKQYSPAIETATRTTSLANDVVCSLVDKSGNLTTGKYLSKSIIFADSSFFEIFTRNIVGNNPKEGLNIKDHIYISRSFAQNLAGGSDENNLIGSLLTPTYIAAGELRFVIDGIFDNFPENSSYKNVDIILSLPTLGKFSWDGTNNWIGNDRYKSFVKLTPTSSAEDVTEGIKNMCEKCLPQEQLKKSNIDVSFSIEPLSSYNIKSSEVSKTCTILLILATVVLLSAMLNYVLIAISAMVHKTKIVAVHKCYGASAVNIYKMVFSEAFIHLFISALFACLLLFAFRNTVEKIIGSSLLGLITPNSIIILLLICIIIFVLCGFLPGMAYSRIPVASAFRRYKESSRKWKLALLFIQFTASTFFVSLLAIVILQYNYMINSNPGYSYKNVVMVNLGEPYVNKKETIKGEVSRLPFVEMTSCCQNLPIDWPSGNNVNLPDDDKVYFNIADMYFAGDGYFKLMEIPIIDGRNFTEEANTSNEVMVSRSFVKKMEEMAGWKDGAVGKNILLSEHSQSATDIYTICGVYDDYLIGTYQAQDIRPSVQFYGGKTMEGEDEYKEMNWLVVKLKEVTPNNIAAIEKIIKAIHPDGQVISYSNQMIEAYKESLRFKDSVLIAGIIVLLITLMGLLGYTQDEVNRRRSEIAIRKINGATVLELLQLFLNNVLKLALPATIVGSVGAYFAADTLLELYTKQITLSWWIFALCDIFILVLISGIVTLKTYSAANANPVCNLKSE